MRVFKQNEYAFLESLREIKSWSTVMKLCFQKCCAESVKICFQKNNKHVQCIFKKNKRSYQRAQLLQLRSKLQETKNSDGESPDDTRGTSIWHITIDLVLCRFISASVFSILKDSSCPVLPKL